MKLVIHPNGTSAPCDFEKDILDTGVFLTSGKPVSASGHGIRVRLSNIIERIFEEREEVLEFSVEELDEEEGQDEEGKEGERGKAKDEEAKEKEVVCSAVQDDVVTGAEQT